MSHRKGGETASRADICGSRLTLWEDADADTDIPILKEAKAEYAKLQ
jgi:hypothetical protein